MGRATEHGQGVPGIFLSPLRTADILLTRAEYDIEPMALKIEERTMLLHDFLIRLAGIIGGLIVCSSYAWRVSFGAARLIKEAAGGEIGADGLANGHTGISAPALPRMPSYDRRRQSYALG